MTSVSPRLEDYLEALFVLETAGNKQTVTALAENLKLTKGTIATVIKKMADQDLVLHEAYGAIRLTPKGRLIGWQVYMKHEKLTAFFQDFLGQGEKSSEEMACLIEHHLDGAAANRFFNLIDFLQQEHFEKKEWMRDLVLSLENAVRLPVPLTLAVQQCCRGSVCRLTAKKAFADRLEQQGIVLGANLEKVSYQETSGKYAVTVGDKQIFLSADSAATIWII